MNMPRVGKAFFLILASSGARIGEISELEIPDIDFDSDPVRITIRGEHTKTGNSRTIFISNEAKEFLLDWLKVKDEYIRAAAMKGKAPHQIDPDDKKVFPSSIRNAGMILNTSLYRLGMDKKDPSTRRMLIHPHSFRKYFNTTLKANGVPQDIVEALLGHEYGLDQAYRRYSIEQMAEFYKKAEPAITVMSDTQELMKLKKEESENRGRLGDLYAKNMDLEKRITEVDKILGEVLQSLEQLKAHP